MSLTPKTVPTGAIRYNTDSNKMECFDGTKWWQVSVSSPDLGNSTNSDNHGGARGFHNGGRKSPGYQYSDQIDAYDITTTGRVFDFGDMTSGSSGGYEQGAFSSHIRGCAFGGRGPGSHIDSIEYITMSSSGDSADFGNLTSDNPTMPQGFSNRTRGVRVGGHKEAIPGSSSSFGVNVMDYVTIATTGNAVDYGDMSNGSSGNQCSASPTRGVIMGGSAPSNLSSGASALETKLIQYSTIASTGNTQDFGDCTTITKNAAQAGNATRTVCAGNQYPAINNTIQYITIATTGNAANFGDLSSARVNSGAGASPVRVVFTGGYGSPSYNGTMDYVSIPTLGNAVDFGDLSSANGYNNGFSNAHGGL